MTGVKERILVTEAKEDFNKLFRFGENNFFVTAVIVIFPPE